MGEVLKNSNDDQMFCDSNRDRANCISFVYIESTIFYFITLIYDDYAFGFHEYEELKFERCKSNPIIT